MSSAKKKVKTFKEDLFCQQDTVHKSMVDNPLGFIIFYVLAILFIGFLFQLSQKDFKKKGKKNRHSKLIVFNFILHSFNISFFFILNIAIAFKVKKITIFILNDSKLKFYLIYIISFLISASIFFRVIGTNGLQIVNFLFSFIILFELCIKIAGSERFINWIGESLEKS